MSLGVIGYKNWQNLWQKKSPALWIGGLMAIAGFGVGAILGQREFINLAVWLQAPEKFNQFDWAAFLTWLPPWLIQTIITLFAVWIGLWLIRYVVKRMIQQKIEPRMRQWSSRLDPRAISMRPERRETLRTLITTPINLIALTAAGLFGLTHFIGWTNVTILTSALGIAAAPLIRDLLSGFNIVFEDVFDIGEKVQIGDAATRLEGTVEGVNIRTTSIRASGGELYVVPHGEIRIVRNFSRGDFSTTSLTLKVAATDLTRTLSCLNDLGQVAAAELPHLLEPWQVISASGAIGQHAQLTLLAKARFGQTEQVRLDLLALIQERLTEAGITLTD
jgi:moderate conductance mechanosensitive channel